MALRSMLIAKQLNTTGVSSFAVCRAMTVPLASRARNKRLVRTYMKSAMFTLVGGCNVMRVIKLGSFILTDRAEARSAL